MDIRIDRSRATPLHLQIAHRIRELILTGAIPDGARLPATRKLAETLGVNRSTVVQAYETLWAEGLTQSHVGRGTAVRGPSAPGGVSPGPPSWNMLFAPTVESVEHEVRDLSRLFEREDVVSFAAGFPAPDLYPVEQVTRIVCDVLAGENRTLLQWCSVEGYPPLRRTLAERAGGPSAGSVLVLSGSTQGLFLLARALISPGDFVVVEAPTYLGALQAFRAAGARLVGIPVAAGGMDLEMLETVLSRTQPKFIYTLPTFQNPTGASMSLEGRRGLLSLAYRYRIPVVEDDPYSLLRYDGEAVPTLRELDTQGYVIYLSTFSKILIPGLRVGWLAAPKPVIEQLSAAKHLTDLFTNSVAQAVVDRFCRDRLLEGHLERVRPEYRIRRDAMARALKRHCPSLAFSVPEGGFFVWCRLPAGIGARDLLREAVGEGVSFLTGEIFYPDGRGQDRIRLNFTSQSVEAIERGARSLGRALRRARRGRARRSERGEARTQPMV